MMHDTPRIFIDLAEKALSKGDLLSAERIMRVIDEPKVATDDLEQYFLLMIEIGLISSCEACILIARDINARISPEFETHKRYKLALRLKQYHIAARLKRLISKSAGNNSAKFGEVVRLASSK